MCFISNRSLERIWIKSLLLDQRLPTNGNPYWFRISMSWNPLLKLGSNNLFFPIRFVNSAWTNRRTLLKNFGYLQILLLMVMCVVPMVLPEAFNQYPQGYYPFEESPAKIPPKVRKPPYLQTQVNCPGKYFPQLYKF